MTRDEFRDKMSLIAAPNLAAKRKIACAMLGHSRLARHVGGKLLCSRCHERLPYDFCEREAIVIVNCECWRCKTVSRNLTWRDRVYVED